jgi:hypothetical protein
VLFERLQRECADGATEWDVLTAIPGEVRAGAKVGSGAELLEQDVRHLHKVLAEERVSKGIIVVGSSEDRLVLRLSDVLLLVLSMQPINAAVSGAGKGEAGAMDIVESCDSADSRVVTAEERVLRQSASRALLGALLHLLRGPPAPSSLDAAGLAALDSHGAEGYWRKLAHSAQDAKSGNGKNVIVQQMLQVVRDGVRGVRGMHVRP